MHQIYIITFFNTMLMTYIIYLLMESFMSFEINETCQITKEILTVSLTKQLINRL